MCNVKGVNMDFSINNVSVTRKGQAAQNAETTVPVEDTNLFGTENETEVKASEADMTQLEAELAQYQAELDQLESERAKYEADQKEL